METVRGAVRRLQKSPTAPFNAVVVMVVVVMVVVVIDVFVMCCQTETKVADQILYHVQSLHALRHIDMLHVIRAGCVVCDLNTIAPWSFERTCWRQFEAQ